MSKHTPGPWKSFSTPSGLNAVECVKTRDHLATIYPQGGFHGADEGEANARLMAESPALLKHLKWAMNVICPGEEHCTDPLHSEIRSTIAKAEGGDVA